MAKPARLPNLDILKEALEIWLGRKVSYQEAQKFENMLADEIADVLKSLNWRPEKFYPGIEWFRKQLKWGLNLANHEKIKTDQRYRQDTLEIDKKPERLNFKIGG